MGDSNSRLLLQKKSKLGAQEVSSTPVRERLCIPHAWGKSLDDVRKNREELHNQCIASSRLDRRYRSSQAQHDLLKPSFAKQFLADMWKQILSKLRRHAAVVSSFTPLTPTERYPDPAFYSEYDANNSAHLSEHSFESADYHAVIALYTLANFNRPVPIAIAQHHESLPANCCLGVDFSLTGRGKKVYPSQSFIQLYLLFKRAW